MRFHVLNLACIKNFDFFFVLSVCIFPFSVFFEIAYFCIENWTLETDLNKEIEWNRIIFATSTIIFSPPFNVTK